MTMDDSTPNGQPETGDPCPRECCDGTLVKYWSGVPEGSVYRKSYYRCNRCHARPLNNKRVELDRRQLRRGFTRSSKR